MIFSKKCISMMLLVMVFGQMGAMKRKPEEISSPNKRSKIGDFQPVCPSAPRKIQPFSSRFTQKIVSRPGAGSLQKRLKVAEKQGKIERDITAAIEDRDFEKTRGLLSNTKEKYISRRIIEDTFGSNFPEQQYTALCDQLRKVGGDAVMRYVDVESGKNIFHIATENNQPNFFYNLVLDSNQKFGSERTKELVNARDDLGHTVIHFTGHSAIFHDAVRLGVDPNARNSFGNTALHLTDEKQEIANLLAVGASTDIVNNHGLNPYENGGARSSVLSDPEKIAQTTARGVFNPKQGNIALQILGRPTTGAKFPVNNAQFNRNPFWSSSSSSSGSNDSFIE